MTASAPRTPDADKAPSAYFRRVLPAMAIAGVGGAAALAILAGHPHPHAPDWALLARQPAAIKLHLAAALLALGLGAVQLAAPKGTLPHRALGWTWVALILAVAVSSIFIRVINHGGFSPIHLLSAYVLVTAPLGVMAARRHDVARHGRTMASIFVLGLIVAGAFTFAPGRLMWNLFLG